MAQKKYSIDSTPSIFINEKKVDLEIIKSDLNLLDYFNNKNPKTIEATKTIE